MAIRDTLLRSNIWFKNRNLFSIYILYFVWVGGCLFVCLGVCLSVCLYPINVKTAKPIGSNFFCGTLRDPREVWMIEF